MVKMTATVINKTRAPRLRTYQEAVEYFQTHQRSRGKDLQIDTVHSLSWNCDGTRLACGSRSKRISILQVDNSCRLAADFTASAHSGSVDQVAFQHSNPYMFASASDDRSVCIWDTRHPKKHTQIQTKVPNSYVNWSMCDRYIVFHGRDDKITVVDSRNLTVYKTYEMNREATEIVPHPNGKHLFVATGSGKVEILSMPDLEAVLTIQAHSSQSTLAALAISKDGRKMAVGGNDALVSTWDLESMSCEVSMPRMDFAIRSVAFSADATLLASGSEDHFLDLAWAEDGQSVYNLRTDEGTYSIAWHPRHLIMAYSCESTDSRGRGDDIRLFGLSG